MDSIHYAMCLDYKIPIEIFQRIEDLINEYSHENFNFFVKPISFGIVLRAEEFPRGKNKTFCERCFSPWFFKFADHQDLKKFIEFSIRSLIEQINQCKLVKI